MNQPFDEELISAYLDDELSDEERRDVERLLTDRPEAQRLLDELRGLRESLQSLPVYKLQEDFGAAVLRRAEREMLRPAPAANGNNATGLAPASTEVGSSSPAKENAVQPAAEVERNWRRPAAWSLLAVAAALTLMFVERNQREAQHVAMNPAPKPRLQEHDADAVSAPPTAPEARQADKILPRSGPSDRAETAMRPPADVSNGDALSRDKNLTKGDAFRKATPSDAPTAAVAAKPQSNASLDKSLAGQPVPSGNQFGVSNITVTAAPAAPSNQMLILNGGVPAAMPPVPPAVVLGGQSVAENLGVNRGVQQALPPRAGTAAEPQNPLAQQVLVGAGSGYYALPDQQQLGVVDVTPLIRANDYQRARALVTEYEVARREVSDERAAATELSLRLQNRSREQQTRQFHTSPQAKAGDVEKRKIDPLDARADQLLIVYCDVTPDALERGWTSIMNREQIADLTYDAGGTTTVNGLLTQAPAAPARRQDAQAGEEFVYVVADSKQLEATLDALRLQSEFFLNVRVEAAPDDARQTEWRYRYSRGDDASGANSYAVKNGSAAAGGSLGRSASTGAAPAASLATATPKKTAEEPDERKQALEKNTAALAKTESAAKEALPLNELPKLRETEGLQFGGGNGVAGAANGPAPNAATQNALAPTLPQQAYGYQQQSVAPLSRSQRVSRTNFYDAPAAEASQVAAGRANAAPATTTPSPNVAKATPSVAKALPSPVEVAGNKQNAPSAPGGAVAAPAGPAAIPTPATAPTMSAAPLAAAPAKALGDEKANLAADAVGGSGGTGGGLGGGQFGAVPAPAGKPAADQAAARQAGQLQAGQAAATQSEPPLWYGLPPDYHEALFIFRVVDKPNAEAKPAAKPAQQ